MGIPSPDFVVAGFGPVEVILSDPNNPSAPSYPNLPVTLLDERGDSVDATNEYVAVGVKGGRKDPGSVHIFGMQFGLTGTVLGPNENGGKFGEAVAFGDIGGICSPSGELPPCGELDEEVPDGLLDLIVGAPGVDLAGGNRKDTDWGEAFAYPDVLQNLSITPPGFDTGNGKEEDFGWQIAVNGQEVFVATKWSGVDRRVDVYSPGLTAIDRTLEPPDSLPYGMGDGWASGGIFPGSVGGVPSVIIGAPNANCAGEGSTGVAYLYIGASTTPEVFVPLDPVDASGDTWNAFGWSADVVSAGSFDYVIIGEPGREYEAGDGREGKVYVYQRAHPAPLVRN